MYSLVLSPLGGDVVFHLCSLVKGSVMTSNSGLCNLKSLLILNGDTLFEHFDHSAFIGCKANEFADNLTDTSDAGVQSTSAVGLLCLESIGVVLGLGHDESLVESDKNSSSLCSNHLEIKNNNKIIPST